MIFIEKTALFRRLEKKRVTDPPTIRRTNGRTRPHIEMRGRIRRYLTRRCNIYFSLISRCPKLTEEKKNEYLRIRTYMYSFRTESERKKASWILCTVHVCMYGMYMYSMYAQFKFKI